jgi:hypothetical protein
VTITARPVVAAIGTTALRAKVRHIIFGKQGHASLKELKLI